MASQEDIINQQQDESSSYLAMPSSKSSDKLMSLTPEEIATLRQVLKRLDGDESTSSKSMESDYTAFAETTHAWAVFANSPNARKGPSKLDRLVGTIIIGFQLFTYGIFAAEAIEDYQKGQVPVMTTHVNCLKSDEAPQENFACEAEYTNNIDAFIAFFMLSIFLTPDFLQAAKAIRGAPFGTPLLFACLAGIEVACAFISATIATSYQLYIGQVTDAVEVGVGLLFIRELSTRAYHGIRHKKLKQYKSFFAVTITLVVLGLLVEPLYETMFAAS